MQSCSWYSLGFSIGSESTPSLNPSRCTVRGYNFLSMEVFGIGPLELLLIFLLALILLGPKDMVNSAKKLANWIRGFRESDLWKSTKEISEMPKKIMKETGLEDELSQMRNMSNRTINDVINEVSQTPTDLKPEMPPTPVKPKVKQPKATVTVKRKPKAKG